MFIEFSRTRILSITAKHGKNSQTGAQLPLMALSRCPIVSWILTQIQQSTTFEMREW